LLREQSIERISSIFKWFQQSILIENEEKEAEKKEVQDMETLTKLQMRSSTKDDYKLQSRNGNGLISLDAANWPTMNVKAEVLKYAKTIVIF
jgi:hypothetical protein